MKQINFASGCYTEKQAHVPGACGEGIEILSFDDETGRLLKESVTGGMKNPSYLDWDQVRRTLFAITESSSGAGEIRSFTVGKDHSLIPQANQSGPGRAGCHLKVVNDTGRILAASYLDGCLMSYTMQSGEDIKTDFRFEYKGSGPVRDRQESPHAHQVLPGPDGRYLYVCDLGSDKVWIHDALKDDLPLMSSLDVSPGYGPRHLAFDPGGEYAYILCELVPRLLVARINADDGSLEINQDLSSVGDDSPGGAAPAAVKVHPSGKSVAVSNRFDDTITVFRIGREPKGSKIRLDTAETFSSQGKTPRDICFSPSGRWLLIANQDSNDIQIRSFDSETGLPGRRWGAALALCTPVCLIPLIELDNN